MTSTGTMAAENCADDDDEQHDHDDNAHDMTVPMAIMRAMMAVAAHMADDWQ